MIHSPLTRFVNCFAMTHGRLSREASLYYESTDMLFVVLEEKTACSWIEQATGQEKRRFYVLGAGGEKREMKKELQAASFQWAVLILERRCLCMTIRDSILQYDFRDFRRIDRKLLIALVPNL